MLEEYISLVYEDERKKIPILFRLRDNTETIIKFVIMGIVAVAVIVCLFFCIGGRRMGEISVRVSCMRWSVPYQLWILIVAAVATVLIMLVLGWYKTAVGLRRRADDIAHEKVLVMIKYNRTSEDERPHANGDDLKNDKAPVPAFDYEDELDLSDIKIDNM